MHINDILKVMVERNASDLLIKPGVPPTFRIDGVYQDHDVPKLTSATVRELIGQMTDDKQKQQFDEDRELDLAYSIEGIARFRVNVYLQAGNLAAAIRVIPLSVMSLDQLGMPPILKKLAEKPRGLILLTGPTGSGKSTTVAAMVDHVNTNRRCHIMTIEDPIEFLHIDKKAIVDQREVGRDTLSFNNALKRVLRQDPNVIVIGEMRDLETISIAITAAETGHLVFATLHTASAAQTIDRVVDVFPGEQQSQIRSQLSLALEGVICQVLVPKADGKGRIAAMEILTASSAVRSQIRANDLAMIGSTIMTSKQEGMQTLDGALKELVEKGVITFDAACAKASNPDQFIKTNMSTLGRKK